VPELGCRMKVLGLSVGVALAAALAYIALLGPFENQPARAQQASLAPERPLVFVPGMLGSMLCRTAADGTRTVVWGTSDAIGQFPTLAVASANDIAPCGLIREISYLGIFSQSVYGPFIDRLEQAGYRQGETLFVFDYDWRLSVLDNARRLGAYVEATIPGAGDIDIVAHSMGGLIARTYALEEGGADRIARLVSAGSPWRGSVQVFELLQNGWGLANALMGGLDAFRKTIVSFPSLFEMMPDYDGCCASAFDATSVEAWTALNWTGIEKDGLPDLGEIKAQQTRLQWLLGRPLPASIEEAFVIGVDQRTPQRYELQPRGGQARFNVSASWEGDGTVMRDSALLTERVTYPTSFATHDAILNDPSVQDFVIATLAQGPDAAIGRVPVRKRTSILTALGAFVELVGVAITTDQPAYLPGSTATITVHLRLDVEDPIASSAIRLTVAPPGQPGVTVTLAPDPESSDPSIPLEQSFSAQVKAGETAGTLIVTVALDDSAGETRIVTHAVPVLAP
jgi:pimeloyl-ACP methyl ester carboxylesterase